MTNPITYDTVLQGGRVIDPASGRDGVANVGILRDEVAAITTDPLDGTTVLDVSGQVVCPGFVDLHSHAQGIAEQRLRVLDGVTTALELEAGRTPVSLAYDDAAKEGRPINYGFSSCWAVARLAELAGAEVTGRVGALLMNIANPEFQRRATDEELKGIVGRIEDDLAQGAIGIGILIGYAPLTDPDEYLAVARTAARHGLPTFTHARELIEANPNTPIDGPSEIVRAAAETGAHMHYCHINSTSRRHIERVHSLVEKARREGARVTTEAYPYGAGSTAIGATFLDPAVLPRMGITPASILYLPTGERIADEARLAELRAENPGGAVIVDFLNEADPADRAYLQRALVFEDTAIASDAMWLTWTTRPPEPATWPLPPGASVHPRTSGCYARSIRLLHREWGAMDLPEVIRRSTLVPAQTLEDSVPAMRRKGRLENGDADIVVFDPDAITDQATYQDGTLPSAGISYVLVNGTFVVREGVLVTDAMPGRAIKAF